MTATSPPLCASTMMVPLAVTLPLTRVKAVPSRALRPLPASSLAIRKSKMVWAPKLASKVWLTTPLASAKVQTSLSVEVGVR